MVKEYIENKIEWGEYPVEIVCSMYFNQKFFIYLSVILSFSFTLAVIILKLSKVSYVFFFFIIICWLGLSKKMWILYRDSVTLKTQEARKPHHSSAKQFKPINTIALSNDYAIKLWGKKMIISIWELNGRLFEKKQSQMCKNTLRQVWKK